MCCFTTASCFRISFISYFAKQYKLCQNIRKKIGKLKTTGRVEEETLYRSNFPQ